MTSRDDLLHPDPPLLSQRSMPGRRAAAPPPLDVPPAPVDALPAALRRQEPAALPEVSELDLIRHYTQLSRRNFSIDANFYPLGSCTMKYNPRVNEVAASLPGFRDLHPDSPDGTVQGMLELLHQLGQFLGEITGLPQVSLLPAAGAHGELTGLLIIRAHHRHRGQTHRTRVLIPSSAHGTNPASCTLAGYEAVTIRSGDDGLVDLEHLREAAGPDTAAAMITIPNTLGLFEKRVQEAARIVHDAGGLVYMDGANFNALVGRARPGDFGVDVLHINAHKTFSTPHGGGGPGAGPVCATHELGPYLPVPRVVRNPGGTYRRAFNYPRSIGRIRSYLGNAGVLVRAHAYIRALGAAGLRRSCDLAVLNARYVATRLADTFPLAYDAPCMHEAVFVPGSLHSEHGITTLQVAKRLLDYGIHPPTIYFPLIVPEALMVEPTETESRETLDRFVAVMQRIAEEARNDPDLLRTAPHECPVGRPDEVTAARSPRLVWPQDLA